MGYTGYLNRNPTKNYNFISITHYKLDTQQRKTKKKTMKNYWE